MLYNTKKGIKFNTSDEADTGNAGEQPVRNISIGRNILGVEYKSTSKIKIYSYQIMPKKTQLNRCIITQIFLMVCPISAGAVQFRHTSHPYQSFGNL
jgi:hypothetical protein